MSNPLIPPFGHHLLTFVDPPGKSIDGGKISLAAVKSGCDALERINGSLKLAARTELAAILPAPKLFGGSAGGAKARQIVWESIRAANNLRCVVFTHDPAKMAASLPADWGAQGYTNVCIGMVAHHDHLDDDIGSLLAIPARYRMVLVPALQARGDLPGRLRGIDWVVLSGCREHHHIMTALAADLRATGCSVLAHYPDDSSFADLPNTDADVTALPALHPFGTKVNLARATLPLLVAFSVVAPHFEDHPREISEAELEAGGGALNGVTETEQTLPVIGAVEVDASQNYPVETVNPPEMKSMVAEAGHETSVTSGKERRDFKRLDKIVRFAVSAFKECGEALQEIHDRKLWRSGGYETWESYVNGVIGISKPQAHRLMTASKIAATLSESLPNGNDAQRLLPTSEGQVRPLARLKDADTQTRAWQTAVGRSEGQPTGRLIAEVVAELMGDDTALPTQTPNKRHALAGAYNELLEATKSGKDWESVQRLVATLGEILKLT